MTNKHDPTNKECHQNSNCDRRHYNDCTCTCPPSETYKTTESLVDSDPKSITASPDSQYREDKEVGWDKDFREQFDNDRFRLCLVPTITDLNKCWLIELVGTDVRSFIRTIEASAYARGKEDGAREMVKTVRDIIGGDDPELYPQYGWILLALASLTPLAANEEGHG